MRKQIAVTVVFVALLTASVYAQTTDFFELAKTGTRKMYKPPSTMV